MELYDYTGKLNNHDEYLKVLKLLQLKTKYIEVVILDGKKSNKLIDEFKDEIIISETVSKWWGTITKRKNNLYRIKSSNRLFEYLSDFETFCKYYEANEVNQYDCSEITDFGIDDIAFYDGNDNLLLCTTTHEGFILINKDLMS